MANRKKRTLTSAGVTLETLEQTVRRAMDMLIALGTSPGPFGLMYKRGYTEQEHDRGWVLVHKLVGHPAVEPRRKTEAAMAVTELDNWDEEGLRMARAALIRFPEVAERLLAGLVPVEGNGAVENVAILLDRLRAEETTEEGPAALARLATAGLSPEDRKHLAGLVKLAKSAAEVPEPAFRDTPEYVELLLDLRDWYLEWSEVARITIKRRDYLIRMGLAERRSTDPVDPAPFVDPTEDPAVDPTEEPDPNKRMT